VKIHLYAGAPGSGYVFENEILGGAIPQEFIKPVKEGIREALARGVLAGYPVDDVRIHLYDGSYHDVDSSQMAFKIAGSMAFHDAAKKAAPVLLEPVMHVEVLAPTGCMPNVIADLSNRRGHIQPQEDRGGAKKINAHVPLSQMFGYSTHLRELTRGRGTFVMHFDHYQPVRRLRTMELRGRPSECRDHGRQRRRMLVWPFPNRRATRRASEFCTSDLRGHTLLRSARRFWRIGSDHEVSTDPSVRRVGVRVGAHWSGSRIPRTSTEHHVARRSDEFWRRVDRGADNRRAHGSPLPIIFSLVDRAANYHRRHQPLLRDAAGCGGQRIDMGDTIGPSASGFLVQQPGVCLGKSRLDRVLRRVVAVRVPHACVGFARVGA
jgi:hypothetical protein